MDTNSLNNALEALGSHLADKELKYKVVAIGGGALLLLGCLIRPTQDIDIVALINKNQLISAKPLPPPLLKAIQEVGSALKLPVNWINSEPAGLWEMGLPKGFQDRLTPICFGGLTLYYASRFDQICFKLYATVDQGPNSKHYADLKLLKPTQTELKQAEIWCKTHDVSELFATHIAQVILSFGESNES
jgi:hypothetical protein